MRTPRRNIAFRVPQIEEELGMKIWERVNTGHLPHAQERHLAGLG